MISVCIATYNGSKYIKEQLDSILSQLSENDEIIISDDNSKDDTLQIIKEINDHRIKVITNKLSTSKHLYSQNHYKVTLNFENTLKHAKGDYVFLSDQDDIWMPNKVKKSIEALKKYDLVLSNHSIIDSEGNIQKNFYYIENPIKKTFCGNLFSLSFPGCCMAFRRNILIDSLPFPKNLIMHDGWIFLLAFINKRHIFFIDEPLIKYRRHSNNVSPSSDVNKNPIYFKIWYRFILLIQILKRKFNLLRNVQVTAY